MLGGLEARVFRAQFSGHSEMDSEPQSVGETKQHDLPTSLGRKKQRAAEESSQAPDRSTSEDPAGVMRFDARDPLLESAIPAPPIVFNFGEFRHKKSAGVGHHQQPATAAQADEVADNTAS